MKKLVLILLLFPAVCFSQAKVTSTASAVIISAQDTAQYRIDQTILAEARQNLTINQGDSKLFLKQSFEKPDLVVRMGENKEKWVYGKLAVYIKDERVDFTQVTR